MFMVISEKRTQEYETEFEHELGPVVISRGIGRSIDPFGAFIRKPNGSLKRFRPIRLHIEPIGVLRQLDEY
jgi:hypothetical protein